MGARPFTDTGLRMLGSLPVKLRGSSDYQAVVHAQAREMDLLEVAIEQARAQLNPASADLMLGSWEALVKLPVGGYGASVPQRRARIIGRLRKLLASSEGSQWENDVTALVGAGWTYLEHIPGAGTGPPANTLQITLPFAPSGDAYLEALREIREITPAHLDIEFLSTAGFVLDESRFDLEGFGR